MGNKAKRQKRAKEKRKQANRDRNTRNTRGLSQQPSDRIEVNYDSPISLVMAGPLVRAAFSVPEILAEKLQQAGRPVPQPVHGEMLIDTGATSTCISETVANELGLKPVGFAETYGAGGLHKNPLFETRLQLGLANNPKKAVEICFEDRTMGIPKLDEPGKNVKSYDGRTARIIGLLGRDFLQNCKLEYDGPNACVVLKVDLSKIAKRP